MIIDIIKAFVSAQNFPFFLCFVYINEFSHQMVQNWRWCNDHAFGTDVGWWRCISRVPVARLSRGESQTASKLLWRGSRWACIVSVGDSSISRESCRHHVTQVTSVIRDWWGSAQIHVTMASLSLSSLSRQGYAAMQLSCDPPLFLLF